MTFALFIPLLILMFVANLGERGGIWRVISFLTNLIADLTWILVAVALAAGMGLEVSGRVPLKRADLHLEAAGWVLLAVGVLALFAMLPSVRKRLRVPGRGFDPYSSTTHAAALLLGLWLVGIGVGQWAAFWKVGNALEGIPRLSLADIVLQGMGEVLLALVGVGWLVRRSTREVFRRLGFGSVKGWHWIVIAAAIAGMYSLNIIYGIGSYLLDPKGIKEIEEINKALLGGMFSPWGALAIGISAGIGEEMIFRGALQPRIGIVGASFLFMLSHTQYAFNAGVLLIFFLGIVLGLLKKRLNLTAAILAHAGYDTIAVLAVVLAQKLSGG